MRKGSRDITSLPDINKTDKQSHHVSFNNSPKHTENKIEKNRKMMMEYDGSVEVDGYENDTDEIKEAFKPSDVKSKKL